MVRYCTLVVVALFAGATNVSCSSGGGSSSDAGNDALDALDAAAPFSLTAIPNPILVPHNGTANLTVTLTRDPAFTADVQVSVTNLPAGVTATTQAATAGATKVVLTLTGVAALGGSSTAMVTGTSAGAASATTTVLVGVSGVPGTQDVTFGNAGNYTGDTTLSVNNGNYAVVVQPDGKIVIAATVLKAGQPYVAVIRLLANGTLDASFNGTGENTTLMGAVGGVALQPDGKIVVGGTQSGNTLAARYTTAGAIDKTFNTQGYSTYVHSGVGPGESGLATLVLPNGEVVVAGLNSGGTNQTAMVVSGFTSTGAVDTAYSGNGIYYGPSGSSGCEGLTMSLQTTAPNSVILGGFAEVAGEYAQFIQFDATGAPAAFDGSLNGLTMSGLSNGAVSLVTLQSQSFRALSVSQASSTAGYNRVDGMIPTGALDTTFNSTGTFSFAAPAAGRAAQMVEGKDHNLVIVGTTTTPTGYVSRVLANGTALDSTFGTNGSVADVFGTGAGASHAGAVAIDTAGSIIVVGIGKITSTTGTLYVTRLWP